MQISTTIYGLWILGWWLLLASPCLAQSNELQFRLEPGLQLNYQVRTGTWFDGADGKPVIPQLEDGSPKYDESNQTVYVLAANPDGSFRVVLHASPPFTTEVLTCADLFPNGSLRLIPAALPILELDSLRTVFPLLPADAAERQRGWSEFEPRTGLEVRFSDDNGLIRGEFCSPLDRVSLGKWSIVYRLDTHSGLPTETRLAGRWEKYGETHDIRTTLESSLLHDPAWTTMFSRDAETYFQAISSYQQLQRLGLVRRAVAERERAGVAEEMLDQAKSVLTAARQACAETIFATRLEQKISEADEYRSQQIESAQRWARIAGLPSPDWTATDLAGQPHSLSDYRGKVVVLDFWFRQCSFCIRAMPQVEKAAALFAKEAAPVAFFGVSVDEEVSDAQFVVDQVKLDYPVLHSKQLAEQYGVPSYPTLLVLAPDGTVQGIFSGYNPQLGENLAECVRTLLPK